MEQGRGRGRASNGQKNAEKKEGKIVTGAMRGDVIQERWQESQKQSKRKGREQKTRDRKTEAYRSVEKKEQTMRELWRQDWQRRA